MSGKMGRAVQKMHRSIKEKVRLVKDSLDRFITAFSFPTLSQRRHCLYFVLSYGTIPESDISATETRNLRIKRDDEYIYQLFHIHYFHNLSNSFSVI